MPDPPVPGRAAPSRVVVAGASGLVGTALVESLRADGIAVTTLTRRQPQDPDQVQWLVDAAPLDPDVLEGADAVVGLNGASIGRFPWTPRYKNLLLWSRILPTQALARAVRALGDAAPAFVSASAVGYYGSRPGVQLTEQSRRGESFLADLCGEWEAAAQSAGARARVAVVRTAPIVHPRGVLGPMMLLTRCGLGGPLSRGTQTWPWISLDDEVRAIRHVIDTGISGPVNLSGPTRATANDLGFAVAVRMNRPYLLRTPEWAMRLVLGSDAVADLITTDAHVAPAVLQESGFEFTHPTVEDAVAAEIPAG